MTRTPLIVACGIQTSSDALFGIWFGAAGSQRIVMRFALRPMSLSVEKKAKPASAGDLPSSSATPKNGAAAAVLESASAAAQLRRSKIFLTSSPFCVGTVGGANGVVGRQSGLGLDGGDRGLGRRLLEVARVQGDTGDSCRAQGERDSLV